ncbi:prohibitin-2, partial [Elysia marginata]
MDPKKAADLAGRLKKAGPRGVGAGLGIFALAGGIYGLTQSVYTVEGGHRAIIFSRLSGIKPDIYVEGLHFRVPWFQYPIIYDIRSRPRKLSSPTGSKDLQMVNISLRVLSRPNAQALPQMYRQLGTDFDERVLPSITNEVAQQDAQRAQFLVEKAIQEKQQKVVQAEGEAEAARLIGEAMSLNPGYLKLRKIRAAQNIART